MHYELRISDKNYPKLLKEVDYPPKILYVRGNLSNLGKCVAVVGTRYPTLYGRRMTETLVRGLVAKKITIISGLARGIDSVAHRACLTAGGRTVAVLGTAIDCIYPPENTELASKIVQSGGAIISETAPREKTKRQLFAARNRIISGMSLGVLVIEGAARSGTKITAGFALDQGREVWAVPGAVDNHLSETPNLLIKMGAKPVTSAEDILEELI